MIGLIVGDVVFSDGQEVVLLTNSGVGYQIYYNRILAEGKRHALYIAHVKREDIEELYGLDSLKNKKLFEMLRTVKGIGPKSAYSLVSTLGFEQITNAIILDQKKVLSQAPGVGPKAAAQIILDLSNKIQKVKIYSDRYQGKLIRHSSEVQEVELSSPVISVNNDSGTEKTLQSSFNMKLLDEALMACKELGFKESQIIPLAQRILEENVISKAEQLVHLVLKEV
ncbi:MAG: hypothetical protein A2504_05260 [Bdellovibrionales bacterium RIFOXYD12_FULL_39_22]|nr:MAG: hypothetical protein A2385_06565 [Bdellovibrionales bacterium RIFOXYB1_FULL_39_21]OFZ41939.1 MAG: hypothetical protein A2485_08535 [Bdellovibrionales bacterium RIFOXYC12_FULL_39_17]OFZ50655.1 MAG: hypothetical protein A2404_05485 [Bdellovibrionales bacterium RIFOXYC1_FULL_39_130]OFZ77878.1 MAG: hypothetical protein A2560_00655 [Bdellovibrionales bacterium RIFOXYD1_FULL_39_84]OFZ93686.1 MAG: hypothetical protein A2504_05260 [Bdellovibrionales bacterium RIFOXYD12_FULL_39_22]HLE10179.1 Ho